MSDLKLYPYQREGMKRLVQGSCLLLDEMGLGKTVQTVLALRVLDPERVLIVCPKSMIHTWMDELERWWTGSGFRVLASGSGSALSGSNARLVTNYEALRGLTPERFDVFVIDEGHRVKNRRAQRSTYARKIASISARKWILTGTPILNRADEIWHLLHLIAPKDFSSYWRFAERWCATQPSRWSKSGIEILPALKRGEERAFAKTLAPYVIRRTKAEVGIQLPPVTRQVHRLDMTDEQKRLHRDLMHNLLVEIQQGLTLTVYNVLSRTVHARRCCVSPLLLGSDCEGAKFAALDDLLEGMPDQKVVVFSQWWEPLDLYSTLRSGMKRPFWTLHGGQSTKQREYEIDGWRWANTPDVLFATIGTGGVGLTLTEAATCIFLDLPWTPAEVNQAIGRLDRIGQTRPVTVHILHCKDSIEDMVSRALGDKQALVDAVNHGISRLKTR